MTNTTPRSSLAATSASTPPKRCEAACAAQVSFPTGRTALHALHSPYWWLRCAVGPTNDTNKAVVAYRKLLEWDITEAPVATRTADRVLNPVLGKSLVVYARKPETP